MTTSIADIKSRCNSIMEDWRDLPIEIAAGYKGALIGHINTVIGEEGRHELFRILFGKSSAKSLSELEWLVLAKLSGLDKHSDVWLAVDGFDDEIKSIVKKRRLYAFD